MSINFPGNPYAGHQPHTEAGGIISALHTLSFEQRTANLIAYLGLMVETEAAVADLDKVAAVVVARLGFPDIFPGADQ